MKERPILFSGEMVRAILDGRKTQTRRIMKPQPDLSMLHVEEEMQNGQGGWEGLAGDACPHGQPGDRLWVRETFAQVGTPGTLSGYVRYKADEKAALGAYGCQKWRPSIFMPRRASRIILEITDVRVERVQGISNADALAEGINRPIDNRYPIDEFRALWDSINAKRGFGWYVNPWVWVIGFKQQGTP
jgi:hypothetical protein